jgi:hypothetical protein
MMIHICYYQHSGLEWNLPKTHNVVAVLNKHEGPWSAECIQAMRDELNIPFKDMQNLRMCIDHAEENPVDLERGFPSCDAIQ